MNLFVRSLCRDRRGGIEGLPLQLMIVILVATMGTAVIVGWMGNIDTPQTISDVVFSDDCLEASDNTIASVTISVYDQDGNPVPEAFVLLSGMGITKTDGGTAYSSTDTAGQVTFEGLKVNSPGKTGFVTATVTKPGYTENNSTQIMVIKG